MADLYLTPAEKYTAALGGFYYGDLPEPGTVYTQLIKDILDGSTPDKVPKNILARFIYSLYISDLGDPYPRYELAKLLYWKLHDITPTKSGSVLTVTIDGKEDYMTINTDLSRLWYKVLFGSKTDVITEFPYIFNTIQNKLSDWELFGNVSVSGTPTPQNPIMPNGTGERTRNLFDMSTVENGKGIAMDGSITNYVRRCSTVTPIDVSTYDNVTLSFTATLSRTRVIYALFNDSTLLTRQTAIFSGTTIDVSSGNKLYICFYDTADTETIQKSDLSNVMLNTGSTALPYEPYGIKIPISSAGQTTPVYLGEVETTRKIKKQVLTGKENITSGHLDRNLFNIPVNDYLKAPIIGLICTHYGVQQNVDSWTAVSDKCTCFYVGLTLEFKQLYIRDSSYSTIADFKSYLTQQYANGTPVTVWYVLAEPETAVVNEPLMKIGNYADSMSRAQTGIDIPTVIGWNTLDVLTTVKPSSMSIEYTSADENMSRSKRISLLKSPLKKGLIK